MLMNEITKSSESVVFQAEEANMLLFCLLRFVLGVRWEVRNYSSCSHIDGTERRFCLLF